MRYFYTLIIFFSLTIVQANAQSKKSLNISKTVKAPKIDGILDDLVWKKTLEAATDFTQF